MKKEIQFTDDDWESMFIRESVTLGKHTIVIEPFPTDDLKTVVDMLLSVQKKFEEKGITFENAMDSNKLPSFAMILSRDCPQIISLATGIKTADMRKLPVSVTLDMAFKVIRVNLSAQEGLEKNLIGLLVEGAEMLNSVLATLPNGLSPTATPGDPSNNTTSAK